MVKKQNGEEGSREDWWEARKIPVTDGVGKYKPNGGEYVEQIARGAPEVKGYRWHVEAKCILRR